MAYGDHSRVQNAIDYEYGLTGNLLDNLRTDVKRQNQDLENRFGGAVDKAGGDYDTLMGGYKSFLNSPGQTTNFEALPGYRDFANTGGYSGQDIQDLRQRAIDPLRGVYSRANSELDRNRALQGGYSPNFAAASSQMARQLGHQVADTNVNVNASLADAIRQGKLQGLGGITDINKAQSAEGIANNAQRLSGMSGATSLFGATPGMAGMLGNQMLTSNNQRLGVEQQQGQNTGNRLQSLLGMSQVPGNFQSAMGNISSVLGLAGQIGGVASGMGGVPGLTSRATAPTMGYLPSGGGGISY